MSKEKKIVKITPSVYDVIVSPLVTEKAYSLQELNKYSFEVSASSNKSDVARAIEALFKVKPESVNIMNVKGKVKRFRGTTGKRRDRKKAIVTLPEGKSINLEAKL